MSAKSNGSTAVSSGLSLHQPPQLDYLKELSNGDLGFIAEILEMFISDAPRSVEQSFRYLQEKNYEMLRITVHKLKSSVQVVGGNHLTGLLQEIESAAKETTGADVLLQMLSVLNAGISKIVEHLCEELKTLDKNDPVRPQ